MGGSRIDFVADDAEAERLEVDDLDSLIVWWRRVGRVNLVFPFRHIELDGFVRIIPINVYRPAHVIVLWLRLLKLHTIFAQVDSNAGRAPWPVLRQRKNDPVFW